MTVLASRPALPGDAAETGAVGYASWAAGLAPLLPAEARGHVTPETFEQAARETLAEILGADRGERIFRLGQPSFSIRLIITARPSEARRAFLWTFIRGAPG